MKKGCEGWQEEGSEADKDCHGEERAWCLLALTVPESAWDLRLGEQGLESHKGAPPGPCLPGLGIRRWRRMEGGHLKQGRGPPPGVRR